MPMIIAQQYKFNAVHACLLSGLDSCKLRLYVQVACFLLHDTVPNCIHWPRQAELKIIGMA